MLDAVNALNPTGIMPDLGEGREAEQKQQRSNEKFEEDWSNRNAS